MHRNEKPKAILLNASCAKSIDNVVMRHIHIQCDLLAIDT